MRKSNAPASANAADAVDTTDPALRAVALYVLGWVPEGSSVGLGTGRAAAAFVAAQGGRGQQGFAVTGVATSQASERQARALGIPIGPLDEGRELDLTVDGADEVAPNLDVVKGRGGALVRERIVAAASKRQVLLVGVEKLVGALGERGPVPIEIIPMAEVLVLRRLKKLGLRPTVRRSGDGGPPTLTDNGNVTLDCMLPMPLADGELARRLESHLLQIPGVVDTGLFLGTAESILVGHPDGRVDVLTRANRIADEVEK